MWLTATATALLVVSAISGCGGERSSAPSISTAGGASSARPRISTAVRSGPDSASGAPAAVVGAAEGATQFLVRANATCHKADRKVKTVLLSSTSPALRRERATLLAGAQAAVQEVETLRAPATVAAAWEEIRLAWTALADGIVRRPKPTDYVSRQQALSARLRHAAEGAGLEECAQVG
jgi:hypothetical protein